MQKLLIGITLSVVGLGCAIEPPDQGQQGRASTGSANTTPSTAQQPLMPFRPVVGGALLVTADRQWLAMADVENDRLRVFNLSSNSFAYDVALPEKSWPTRLIEGHHGELHVLLRGLGSLATITHEGPEHVVRTLALCAEPRALALDPVTDEVTVGCAGGELVRVANGEVVDTTNTGVEWRDLAVTPTGLKGTSFRAAEFITRSNTTGVLTRLRSSSQRVNFAPGSTALHVPQVAWRMVTSGTKTILIHQLHADSLSVEGQSRGVDAGFMPPNGSSQGNNPYGGGSVTSIPGQPAGCSSAAVVTGITVVENGIVTAVRRTNDVLPVDAAISPDGTRLAVVGAGGTGLSVVPLGSLTSGGVDCVFPTGGLTGLALSSVAWISNTRLAVVESLRPAPLMFDLSNGQSRPFGNDPGRASAAFALFHQAPRGGAPLACASCHPEGGEDGHTWVIDGKTRRTQTLAGGVMARAPFHWKGDLAGLDNLMTDTFVRRMGGIALTVDQVTSLGTWLDTIPAPKPSRRLSAEQSLAGVAAFDKAQCSSCHLANGTREGGAADIGTGERVRAPSLTGLFARAPYLHTGQIPDIRSRVVGNLHPQHGSLGNLDSAEREDLIAYLESL